MVLDVSYSPGAFDIDPNTKRRLESLVRILLLAPDIKLEVNGYTDDIGTATANQALSEKRARRVMEFLVLKGVSQSRVKAFGRGEANFVAPNTTAEGRAKNRRIEIVFYK
jgi:outer membrane protein OmpA-like peptidoglycan-associated protein